MLDCNELANLEAQNLVEVKKQLHLIEHSLSALELKELVIVEEMNCSKEK